MRNWLGIPNYGCQFAPRMAWRGTDQPSSLRILEVFGGVDIEVTEALNRFIDQAATAGTAAIIIFPEMRSARELLEALKALAASERWRLSAPPWPRHDRDGVLVAIDYETSTSARYPSKVLGFAPLGSMPVTRRAPYFGLGLWGGGTLNQLHPYRKPGRVPRFVSFADMPIPEDEKARHARRWEESETATAALCAVPPEGAADITITFCLPEQLRGALFP